MKAKELITACNAKLQELFPAYPIYGNDTYDGYERPAFFTELISREFARSSVSSMTVAYTYKLTFLETTHNEPLCLDIIDTIQDSFGLTLKTASGYATVETIDFDWIDSNNDVLQITIDFASVTSIRRPDVTAPVMEVLDADISVNHVYTTAEMVIADIKSGKLRLRATYGGRLKLYSTETGESNVTFDLVSAMRLSESIYEELDDKIRFWIDESGNVKAECIDQRGRLETFNVYVEELETFSVFAE